MSTDLDVLVPAWLTLPDLAERLDADISRVRGLVRDRVVVGVKRGERTTFQVPEAFLVPDEDGGEQVLPTLRGTVVVLGDQGLTDEEILVWLFTPEDALGVAPVEALRAGRRAEVRRIAQALPY
ncbi:Rv2175c family DNA-binding protein [Xylanimonas protaetiae]|uniref:DNA-binding protein n=1 Tax=Xylanimonas protaetiae TaxID=2509457 RepID=A0A4P6F6M4_9MICO|nr:Rv2175c family DNA-binding protein [Xylanimonas protaetiae]QAY71304.1 DNA-binding protein [Xylanimonas protaetiae]